MSLPDAHGRVLTAIVTLATFAAVVGCVTAPSPTSTATPATPTDQRPIPAATRTPRPTPTAQPTLDAAALDAARETCRGARPADLFDAQLPGLSPDRGGRFSTLALVLVDLRTLDGEIMDAPSPPDGRSYYYASQYGGATSPYPPLLPVVERPLRDAELLGCIDQRVNNEASYCRPAVGGCTTAVVADALVYPVEASTGTLAGGPWMVGARDLPSFLVSSEGFRTELNSILLPVGGAEIVSDLLYFMEAY